MAILPTTQANSSSWNLYNTISQLQGGSPNLQGSSPNLQGSSPQLQGSSPNLQGSVPNLQGSTSTGHANVQAPTDPNGTAGTGTEKPDRTNDINVNNAALDALPSQRQSGLDSIQAMLDRLFGRYGSEATANEANYTGSSNTNKNNLQRNTQAALLQAAQGRKGLFGVLAGIGALSGSGVDLANKAVQEGANADLSGANDTFGDNKSSLDTAFGNFKTADEKRREDASTAADASRTGVEHDTLTSRQKAYSNLADDYSQMGDEAKAKEYSDLVASLFPDIARTSVAPGSIAYSGAAYDTSPLAKYVGGESSTQVQTTPSAGSGSLPGLVALNPLKKKPVA